MTSKLLLASLLSSACSLALAATTSSNGAQGPTWTPLSSGGKSHVEELTSTSAWPVPASLAVHGGQVHVTLVGGGEGGSSSAASCDDYAVQGGKGGDGGEVVEVNLTFRPGMCTAGLAAVIGQGGRGALRGGNSAPAGEAGGATSLTCSGTTLATALGGGRRTDNYTAPRSAKGGAGGVVMNTFDQVTAATTDQRSMAITAGGLGQTSQTGYGSGGGGGGASVVMTGTMAQTDGQVVHRATTRNAPLGRGGYGGGAGAGPAEYGGASASYPAENAAQYGAGGGGGGAMCGGAVGARDGGNGYQGLIKIQWTE